MNKILLFCLAICFVLLIKFSSAQTQVTFYTSMGTFVAEMYDTIQPITSGNFVTLVNAKYYDGIIFHRVINGFMIQGGDPTGTGYGGPGYAIADEFDTRATNKQKALAMANSGPNTGGSQFFINLVNNGYLNPNYPVFGIVITNFSVVQAIGNVATNSSDRPITDVVMDSLRVTHVGPLGIRNEANNSSLSINIYPNPATDESMISIHTKSEKMMNVSIYDQLGRIVYNKKTFFLKGANFITLKEIQKDDLTPGLYHVAVMDGESITQKKFLLLK